MNGEIVRLIKQLHHARTLHGQNCPVALRMVGPAFSCSLCDALAERTDSKNGLRPAGAEAVD